MAGPSDGRILVTGAAGFIGSHLVRALERRGHDVAGLDSLCVPPLTRPRPDLATKDVRELTDADLDGVSCVYHLAAWRSVPDSFVHPSRYAANVDAALHLVDLARRCRIPRIVLGGSCEVYGARHEVPTREDTSLAPRSPYATSKAGIEMLRALRSWDLDLEVSIARLFNVYGPAHRPDTVIASFCRSGLTDGVLRVEGSGAQRRDFSFIDSTLAKLVRMLEIPRMPRVVNIGSGCSTSVAELAAMFQQLIPGLVIRHSRGRPMEIPDFRADTFLAAAVLGHVPSTPMADGLRETLAWWRWFLQRGEEAA